MTMRDNGAQPSDSSSGESPAALATGLRIVNARLAYAGTLLFDNLSADIAGGQWTCILGPSGVGKSTLLRMIAGLGETDPVTEITAADGSALGQRIAWMAQQDLLLPWLSVAQNVALGNILRAGSAACCPMSVWKRVPAHCRLSYPAASASGPRWRAR